MYPSGQWAGFWQQDGWGRQSMKAFQLQFQNGTIRGGGIDVVGPFSFVGEFDPSNGMVKMIKKYLDAHRVEYVGKPDGEGCIMGTWRLEMNGTKFTGPFLMKPLITKPHSDDSIREIKPSN